MSILICASPLLLRLSIYLKILFNQKEKKISCSLLQISILLNVGIKKKTKNKKASTLLTIEISGYK